MRPNTVDPNSLELSLTILQAVERALLGQAAVESPVQSSLEAAAHYVREASADLSTALSVVSSGCCPSPTGE